MPNDSSVADYASVGTRILEFYCREQDDPVIDENVYSPSTAASCICDILHALALHDEEVYSTETVDIAIRLANEMLEKEPPHKVKATLVVKRIQAVKREGVVDAEGESPF